MKSFQEEKILFLMEKFHTLTKLSCHIYTYEADWLNSDTFQPAPLCDLIQTTRAGMQACLDCDARAFAQCAGSGRACVYQCHAGLTECVVPMRLGSKLLGFLTFGRVLCYPSHEEAFWALRQRCEDLQLPEEALWNACRRSPLVEASYVEAAEAILSAIGSYIVLEGLYEQKQSAATELDIYLKTHYTEPLTTESICRALKIGRTQLYKLSDALYGQGIARQIRTMRIELAKKLLSKNKAMSVGEIAFACGFSNYNHFIKIFSAETGTPPLRYRKTAAAEGDANRETT